MNAVLNDPMNILWGALKSLYLLGGGVYVVFAIVVMSQVRSMTETLNGSLDSLIKLIAFVHLLVAVGALILAFVVL